MSKTIEIIHYHRINENKPNKISKRDKKNIIDTNLENSDLNFNPIKFEQRKDKLVLEKLKFIGILDKRNFSHIKPKNESRYKNKNLFVLKNRSSFSSCKQDKFIQPLLNLPSLKYNQFIFHQKNSNRGYWLLKHKQINVVKPQNGWNYLIRMQNIVSIYGKIIIPSDQEINKSKMSKINPEKKLYKEQKIFLITDNYEDNTLKSLLEQFGALSQTLIKKYIKQLILALRKMHCNLLAHNRLSLQTVCYNQNGQIFINMSKASINALSSSQKQKNTYNYPPQLLLQKTQKNSQKNDIWGLGCITLKLLTNTPFKDAHIHPYNMKIKGIIGLSDQMLIIDQIQELFIRDKDLNYKTLELQNTHQIQRVYRSSIIKSNKVHNNNNQISLNLQPSALDFILKCLCINTNRRPDITELMLHSFLKE